MPLFGVALALMAFVPQTSALQAKIQYSTPGAQVQYVLADLSKSCGTLLEAAPQTMHEVLAVRLQNVSLQEAMKRIAWAVDGGWKETEKGFRLIRSPEQQRQEERQQLEETATKFKKLLDAQKAALDASPRFTPADASKIADDLERILKQFNPANRAGNVWQRANALDLKGPPGRALNRLALLFDPEELAAIPPRMKVVYSSKPTPTQRPMGQKALAIIDQYIREQNIWSTEATKRKIHNPQIGNTTYLLGGLSRNTEPLTEKIGKVLFTVTKWEVDQPPQLSLMVADEKGKFLVECSGSLGASYAPAVITPPPAPAETKIKVPPSVVAFSQAWDYRKPQPLQGELKNKLLQPEKFDALGLGVGALLVVIAENKKASMVANLPDEAAAMAGGSAGEIAPEQFLNGLTGYNFDRDKTDGWILLRPKSLSRSRARQIDRATLGAYIRKYAATGKVNLDDRAAFTLGCPEDGQNMLLSLYEWALGAPRNDYYDENTLRLYGSLSPEQKIAARKDGIQYSTFSPYQLHLVQRMLYGENTWLQFQEKPGNAGGNNDSYDLHYNGLLREVTEALPNRVPLSSVLTMSVTTSDVAFSNSVESGGINYGSRNFSPEDYAYHRFAMERPDIFPWMKEENEHFDLDHLRFGAQTSITLTLRFNAELSIQNTLQATDFGANKVVAFNDLPEAFRKKVEARIADLRKSYANQRGVDEGGTGTGTIPPSP